MRIVQTFWTAGRDPLKYSFGWTHPEYNLMSWALSCLSLREHYDEVVLYTDQEGYNVLINKLHLPYTEVNVVYDKNLYLPHHWAYAKIKTYSMQTKPFIHVDGDVYLPKPIPKNIINAPLIAQNKEIGTGYYRDMMYRVLHNPRMQLPVCVTKGLQEDSIGSYNMGVFGGSNLHFINQYCNEVQKFLNRNEMNNSENVNSKIECNVFFEQILFAALVEEKQEQVCCVINHDMYDQGYTISEFCNLYKFYEYPMHHLLGGHKRNIYVQRMLRHSLAYMYPTMFKTIFELTQKRKQISMLNLPKFPKILEGTLTTFSELLEQQITKWSKLSLNSYLEYEAFCYGSTKIESYKTMSTFVCNPYLCLYTFKYKRKEGNDETDDMIQLRRLFHCEKNFPLKDIAIIPDLIGDGYELVPLIPIDIKIIDAIRSGANSISSIRKSIFLAHQMEVRKITYLTNYIIEEINHLIIHNILIKKK